MRITISGSLPLGVSAKDIALHWIARLGTSGARGHAIEYSGTTIDSMSMEARMTLCNMSIEGGARFGLIAPDTTTYRYIKGRPYAPHDERWQQALEYWQHLHSETQAHFDKEISIDASTLAPTVTWGTSPDQAIPVTAHVPNPNDYQQAEAQSMQAAIEYMGLKAGQNMEGTPIDQVFLGSCTNGRLEDIRSAATILKGRRAKVPGLVSPGSTAIKAQAEKEGLDKIFLKAGLEWAASGCSSCVGMNGDTVAAGLRCASTTNRNFKGRQGPGSRTHLMSPAMVAAAAVHGKIVDVRSMNLEKAAT